MNENFNSIFHYALIKPALIFFLIQKDKFKRTMLVLSNYLLINKYKLEGLCLKFLLI